MKRLRHPIRAIREPFGTAGLIVAMLALVAALGGSALAANGALSGKQRKEVEKIAKKLAGKPGAPGAGGAAGAAGKDGAGGKEGAAGKEGSAGKAGNNGTNGTTGFTEFLPEGKTETGTFTSGEITGTTNVNILTAIAFPIPLEAPLGAAKVHYVTEAEQVAGAPTECPGTVEAPSAEAGSLCVYQGGTLNEEETAEEIKVFSISPASALSSTHGASTAGAILGIHYQGPNERGILQGTWAVTAP